MWQLIQLTYVTFLTSISRSWLVSERRVHTMMHGAAVAVAAAVLPSFCVRAYARRRAARAADGHGWWVCSASRRQTHSIGYFISFSLTSDIKLALHRAHTWRLFFFHDKQIFMENTPSVPSQLIIILHEYIINSFIMTLLGNKLNPYNIRIIY